MSTNLRPQTSFQGVKRDVHGQPKGQSQQNSDISPQTRHALEQISTPQLISIFEPAIRQHLKYRIPEGDIERVLGDVKTKISREEIMKLAEMLPLVMAELKESGQHQANRTPRTEVAQAQQRDTQMESFPHASPPPPYEVHLVPPAAVPSDPAPSNVTNIGPLIPQREPTVFHGLYLAGIGKHKTSKMQFDISEVNSVRALAWSRRILAFDRSNEHLMYHFKAVLTEDVGALFNTLATLNIVEPTRLSVDDAGASDDAEHQEAFKNALSQYHQIVAQSIYKLPTVWPPSSDFLVDLNEEKSRELIPQTESDPYIDVTELIRSGSNVFTLVEFKDMRKYTFCLFEKRPTVEEIEEAARL